MKINTRHVISGVAFLFALAALYLSVLIDRRQDALSKASRYDLSWTAAQTTVELARFGQVVAAYATHENLAQAEDVRLRFELFLSRIDLLDSAAFVAFAEEKPDHASIIRAMKEAAEAITPLVADIEMPGNAEQAFGIVQQITTLAASLASAANHSGGEQVYADYQELIRLHWTYSGLTFLLVLSGLVLLFSLQRQNQTLVRTRKEAEEARALAESGSRAKTEFLAVMSHEIRTPLHGIMGFTDLMLSRKDLPRDVRRSVECIRTSGTALLTVVNDVLDFSKIEAGAVEIDRQPFNLDDLIENCCAIIRELAASKDLDLKVIRRTPLPRLVIGDEPRLRQVLLNLLNNAIKFTHHGTVNLSVDYWEDNEQIRFLIEDTGIGIPPEKRDRLFQRFSQVDASATRKFGGTGLGLAISRSLVELMDGEIGFSSEEGKGSTFWFSLPLPLCAEELPAKIPAPADPMRAIGPARLLLAEDVEINQEIARAVLESGGLAVDIVADGAAAVEAVKTGRYDLVLMDIQMPVVDGVSATRLIRALDFSVRDIPIIAMTANVYREQVASFLAAGMNAHIGKPFKRDELLATIQQWLPAGSSTGPSLDRDVYGEVLQAIGREGMIRLLDRLAQQIARCSAKLTGPSAADRGSLARDAHALISTAGQLGFHELSEACRELEQACHAGADLKVALAKVESGGRRVLGEIAELRTAA
jgi:signal transduction histidine kinase/CheY-like chemotaxis protein/HPt (histidine-containing phosphotransfer) domain-containing protein